MRIVECLGIQKELYQQEEVMIFNMVNPPYAGILKGFKIELLEKGTNILREYVEFEGNLKI